MIWIFASIALFALTFAKLGALTVWVGVLTTALEIVVAAFVGLLVLMGWKSRPGK